MKTSTSTALAGLFLALTAQAQDPTLRITSFVFPHNGIRFAELCGVVHPAQEQNQRIRIVVDPNTQVPGVYMAETDRAGRFCILLRSLSGRALVEIEGSGAPVEISVGR